MNTIHTIVSAPVTGDEYSLLRGLLGQCANATWWPIRLRLATRLASPREISALRAHAQNYKSRSLGLSLLMGRVAEIDRGKASVLPTNGEE